VICMPTSDIQRRNGRQESLPLARWEMIGPDEARAMLAASEGFRNRVISTLHVQRMAGDMRSGRWRAIGDTIKITSDGTVVDGQHRLRAIVEAGVRIRLLVVRGVAQPDVPCIDTVRPRSVADQLRMDGVPNYFNVASLVQKLWRYEHRQTFVQSRGAAGDSPSKLQALDYYATHKEELESAVARVKQCSRRLGSNGVLTACYVLFARIHADDAEDFLGKLESGSSLPSSSPIILLRNRLLDVRANRVKPPESILAALCIKAWNAYRDGRSLAYLAWRPGGANPERFPEPV
jgi:hypothetical protein